MRCAADALARDSHCSVPAQLRLRSRAGAHGAHAPAPLQVKLAPALTDAWIALGNVFWRRSQLVQAHAAFTAAQARSPSAAALRNLSGVTRGMAQGASPLQAAATAAAHARRRTALTVKRCLARAVAVVRGTLLAQLTRAALCAL